MSTERIIVQRAIIDEFRVALKSAINEIYGDHNPAPTLINSAGVEKNKNLVKDAAEKGAVVAAGDVDAPATSEVKMRPIVVEGVTEEMDIFHAESFGPTVSLIVVDSDEEALKVANNSEYGLSTAIFTENLGRGLKIARELETG